MFRILVSTSSRSVRLSANKSTTEHLLDHECLLGKVFLVLFLNPPEDVLPCKPLDRTTIDAKEL